MSDPTSILEGLDNFAGLAALVNGLILWPMVRSLKKDQSALRAMLQSLLARRKPTRRKAPRRKVR